jgi:hypothetical protein
MFPEGITDTSRSGFTEYIMDTHLSAFPECVSEAIISVVPEKATETNVPVFPDNIMDTYISVFPEWLQSTQSPCFRRSYIVSSLRSYGAYYGDISLRVSGEVTETSVTVFAEWLWRQ